MEMKTVGLSMWRKFGDVISNPGDWGELLKWTLPLASTQDQGSKLEMNTIK